MSDKLPERWVPFIISRMPNDTGARDDLIAGKAVTVTGKTLAAYLEDAYRSGQKSGSRRTAHAMALLIQKVTQP